MQSELVILSEPVCEMQRDRSQFRHADLSLGLIRRQARQTDRDKLELKSGTTRVRRDAGRTNGPCSVLNSMAVLLDFSGLGLMMLAGNVPSSHALLLVVASFIELVEDLFKARELSLLSTSMGQSWSSGRTRHTCEKQAQRDRSLRVMRCYDWRRWSRYTGCEVE